MKLDNIVANLSIVAFILAATMPTVTKVTLNTQSLLAIGLVFILPALFASYRGLKGYGMEYTFGNISRFPFGDSINGRYLLSYVNPKRSYFMDKSLLWLTVIVNLFIAVKYLSLGMGVDIIRILLGY